MNIEIFDVELGQCVMIHCPNGQKIMIDAGHNSSRPWHPSTHFFGQNIERLVISNFDEDHVSDFVDLNKFCTVRTISRNETINSNALHALKGGLSGMGNGIKAVYEWMQGLEWGRNGSIAPNDLAGVEIIHYRNPYGAFTDTNNLSLVTFVKYGAFSILFPGDLEIAGWKEMLKDINFRTELSKITVLIASHHGRENGCCGEVFNFCSPQAVIISDSYKQHGTQETSNWYASKVSGCKTIGQTERKILTTRNDGHITLEAALDGTWYIATEAERAQRQRRM